MLTRQELLHSLALQKHTSIYLGNNFITPKKPKQTQIDSEQNNTNQNDQMLDNQRKQIKQYSVLNPQSLFKSVSKQMDAEAQKRQQIIKSIKSHPLYLSTLPKPPQIHPFQRIQNQLNFQTYCQQLNKQEEEQNKLIAQYFKSKKQKKIIPKPKVQTASVLVPSYLQSLMNDIHKLSNKKKELKAQYQRTKDQRFLDMIIELNNNKMKPALNQYLSKIMGITITQQTDEQEIVMMLSMGQNIIQGRSKKDLVDLFIKNLKDIASEQRQYKITNQNNDSKMQEEQQ